MMVLSNSCAKAWPSVYWNLLHACTPSSQMFLNTVLDCYLVQVVDKPTRGDNILDLMLTSNKALIDNVNIEEPFVSLHHCVARFDITVLVFLVRKYWKLFSYFQGLRLCPKFNKNWVPCRNMWYGFLTN